MRRYEPETSWAEWLHIAPFALLFLLLAGLAGCSWGLYPVTCEPTWFTSCGRRPEPVAAPPMPTTEPAPAEQPTPEED